MKRKMKMKAALVTYFLIAQVIFALADQKPASQKPSDVKKRENAEIGEAELLSAEERSSPEAQRKRDSIFVYHRSRPHSHRGRHPSDSRRPGYQGRLQSQINRPFKNYGPPTSQNFSPSFGPEQPKPSLSLVNQDAPEPVRQHSFVPESPIASQNSQPFGQHTANYLPPRNQKLPSDTPPYQFSTHEFFDNQQFQQQQQPRFPDQSQQLQAVDNQNFFNQNNFESQNDFQVQGQGQQQQQQQQISDAALFLTQNAQAISNLYGAPAPDQNYAPINQEFEPIDNQQQQQQQIQSFQQNQQSQNLQIGIPNQLPSYASGVLGQETLEKIQSLEKDRIIAQLQEALSNRENAARFAQSDNSQADAQSQFARGDVSFAPSPSTTSVGFQGYYATSPAPIATPTNPISVQSPSTITTTTATTPLQSASAQAGVNLQTPQGFNRPAFAYPQYAGFVPTIVSPSGFLPSAPTFGTPAVFPTTTTTAVAKPINDNAPTHFAIPLPAHPTSVVGLTTTPATAAPTRPPHQPHPGFPSRPTINIPLGSVRPPVQASPPVVAVKPPSAAVPVHPTYGFNPAATPIHPTYGLHPAAAAPIYGHYHPPAAVVNPSVIYKPVKAYPVYYYPGVYRKPVVASPWSYAPSYTQAKLWK